MSIGMVGRKIGMTRVFTENGASIPVTVIQVEANRVTQVKNTEKDGYTAIQVTTGTVKQNRLNKPEKGLFAKTGVEAGRGLWEFRIDEKDIGSYKVGDEVKAETVFKDVKRVDVTGTSKGKGTQVVSRLVVARLVTKFSCSVLVRTRSLSSLVLRCSARYSLRVRQVIT